MQIWYEIFIPIFSSVFLKTFYTCNLNFCLINFTYSGKERARPNGFNNPVWHQWDDANVSTCYTGNQHYLILKSGSKLILFYN